MASIRVDSSALNYEGGWSVIADPRAGLGSRHEAETDGAVARWRGAFRSAKLYARVGSYGLAEIWLDGKLLEVVDMFGESERGVLPVWSIEELDEGFHVLDIRLSGNKNARSSSCRINIDGLELDCVKPASVRYNSIICVGDSITFGANVGDRPRGLYGRRLQDILHIPVSVHGLSGASIDTVTSVLDAVAAPRKPDLVLWLAGMNDTSPYAAMTRGIERMEALMPYARLIVSTIPYNTYYSAEQNRRKVDEVMLACKEKSISCIDLYGMTYGNAQLHEPENTVHPNSEGHSVIAAAFYKEIIRQAYSD